MRVAAVTGACRLAVVVEANMVSILSIRLSKRSWWLNWLLVCKFFCFMATKGIKHRIESHGFGICLASEGEMPP